MKLLPGQRSFIDDIFSRPDSDPVRIAVHSESRGNGKSGLAQALVCAGLVGPLAVARGEIYAAAVDRTQSSKLFNEVEATILAVPELAAQCNIQRFAKKIEVLEGDGAGSIFEAMSGDARKGHGLAPGPLWIYDELARVQDRELLDALITGMNKRPCLGIVLSTQAPTDDHPLSQLIDNGLNGTDRSILVRLTQAPPEADPFDPATLRACNPAIGHFLDERGLLAEQERARLIPSFEPAFRNLRLNQRVDANAEARVVPITVWRQGAELVNREALKGRRCFGGLDLSGKHDLTALVLVFPSDDPEPIFDVLPLFWTPQDALAARRAAEQQRFKEWIAADYMKAIPGPTIRTGFIAAELARIQTEFDVRAIAYDRWRIDDLKQDLADADCTIPLEPRGQGFKDAGPDIEVLAELALTGRLRHGGHPVLTAAVANAVTVSDPAGNLKVDKERGNKRGPVRIDGAVALAMALGLASRHVEAPKPLPLDDFLRNPVIRR
jgi:phage terminase large subunit-like protein